MNLQAPGCRPPALPGLAERLTQNPGSCPPRSDSKSRSWLLFGCVLAHGFLWERSIFKSCRGMNTFLEFKEIIKTMKRKYKGPAGIGIFPHLYHSLLFPLCLQEITTEQIPNWFLGNLALRIVLLSWAATPSPGKRASLPKSSRVEAFRGLGQRLALFLQEWNLFSDFSTFNTLMSCVHPDWPRRPEIIFVLSTS